MNVQNVSNYLLEELLKLKQPCWNNGIFLLFKSMKCSLSIFNISMLCVYKTLTKTFVGIALKDTLEMQIVFLEHLSARI